MRITCPRNSNRIKMHGKLLNGSLTELWASCCNSSSHQYIDKRKYKCLYKLYRLFYIPFLYPLFFLLYIYIYIQGYSLSIFISLTITSYSPFNYAWHLIPLEYLRNPLKSQGTSHQVCSLQCLFTSFSFSFSSSLKCTSFLCSWAHVLPR